MKYLKEAKQLVAADGQPRVLYQAENGEIGTCLLAKYEDRPILDEGLCIIWDDIVVESLI